ncbi:DNA-directed RNA polymerase subunit alpha [Candidatus Uhrbacteria bacterium]|nr:DNA-directed RNA polymerase subunit alpha [Candidatus Uhrbacteria bacterium]
MERIPLPPKIDFQPGERPHETIVTIEPLFPGYGNTIGNALRRVLLSSLVGGAAVAVKIKGVLHEFSTISYVKEDIVDIILNIKKLRFKVHTDETVRLVLRAKGEKEVTGADIESNSDAEIANPEASICSLTNKNAQIEIELFVRRGRGYLSTEAREKEKLEIGTIAIDALFTPMRNVGFQIENVRVGQMTNYDKVVMTVETDGSITGQEAVQEASRILVDHFSVIHASASGVSVEEQKDQKDPLMNAEEFQEETASLESDEVVQEKKESGEEEEGHEEKVPKKRGRPKKGS